MKAKYFKIITISFSIGLMFMYILSSLLFFKDEVIFNSDSISLFNQQVYWFVPTIIMLIFFMVPVTSCHTNTLLIGNVIYSIGYFVVLGCFNKTALNAGLSLHNVLSIFGYVLLALMLVSSIVDVIMRVLYKNKLSHNWPQYSNLVILGATILSFILISIGWVIATKNFNLLLFSIIGSLTLCLNIYFLSFVFVNNKFDVNEFVGNLSKKPEENFDEITRQALQEASHNTQELVGGGEEIELNQSLNKEREEYLKMMQEGLSSLNDKKTKKSKK